MEKNRSRILVVDDEAPFRQMMCRALSGAGHEVCEAASGEEALDCLALAEGGEAIGLVFLDLRMKPDGLDGIRTLELLREQHGELPVVVVSAFGDVRQAVAAMKLGALDFLEKPVDLRELRRITSGLFGADAPASSALGPLRLGGIECERGAFYEALSLLQAAASSSAPLLITGESGTGKELAAAFAHERSAVAAGPFVKVNCAAIPGNLLEAEMFGVEKGAFTGANVSRPGRFEAADGGTLLLDEIGELEVSLQAKLLRVLQEKEVERVGGNRARRVNVRVIATTNRELHKEMERGAFREDLYFRLNVFEIHLPPLREHPEDILPLARHFARTLSPTSARRLAPEAEQRLLAYEWPGNIRELHNAIERAAILARGGVIHVEHLPPSLRSKAATLAPARRAEAQSEQHPAAEPEATALLEGASTVQEMERALIVRTLAQNGGNRTQTAKALGLSRRALHYKLNRYGIE
ncbi:MAG: sigma-54 dependent transcriptional regulator [Myxococcota bacterium]|nr:sigma-54 dependent transcriptional regulator [Myxococcota bacterium]